MFLLLVVSIPVTSACIFVIAPLNMRILETYSSCYIIVSIAFDLRSVLRTGRFVFITEIGKVSVGLYDRVPCAVIICSWVPPPVCREPICYTANMCLPQRCVRAVFGLLSFTLAPGQHS